MRTRANADAIAIPIAVPHGAGILFSAPTAAAIARVIPLPVPSVPAHSGTEESSSLQRLTHRGEQPMNLAWSGILWTRRGAHERRNATSAGNGHNGHR